MDKTDIQKRADELLVGTVDMHLHSAPSIYARRADDMEVALEAKAAGMKAFVLKSHESETATRTYMLRKNPELPAAYGSITLNEFVGGLNPAAVEVALKLGAKCVWLPTMSARKHQEYLNKGNKFLGQSGPKYGERGDMYMLDENGKLLPVLYDIFDLVSDYGAIIATGHISGEEGLAVAKGFFEKKRNGYFVLTHPDSIINPASIDIQKEVASMGGYIEKYTVAYYRCGMTIADILHTIDQIGIEHCFVSTDVGGVGKPSSPDAFRFFISSFLEEGVSEKNIRYMFADLPSRLLNID